MNRPKREFSLMVAVGWGFLSLVRPDLAAAQDSSAQEGPIVIRRRDQFERFRIENIRTTLELLAEYQSDRRSAQGARSTRDEEFEFRSFLRVDADAYIIHPNFIELTMMGRLEYRQTDIDSDTNAQSGTITDLLGEYDLRALALKKTDAPIDAYTRRAQLRVDRQFGESLDSVVTEYGIGARLSTEKSTNRIRAFIREQRQTDQRGRLDFGNDQATIETQSTFRIADRQSLVVDYAYDNIDEFGATRRAQSFERHDLDVNHQWWFDEDRRYHLQSWFNLYDQKGNFENTRLRVLERMTLRHTSYLETIFNYQFNEVEQQGLGQRRHRGQAGLRHKLYDSLTTLAQVGASRLDIDDGEGDDEFFASLALDYTKRVPFGRFLADFTMDYSDQDNGARGSNIPFIDEMYTFNDPDPVVIFGDNIIASSIVVTDSLGIQTYLEGIDYRVDEFPDRVELVRLLGGDIADGETVLVDYVIGPQPPNQLKSLATGAGLRYQIEEGPLGGLAVWGRYLEIDQELEATNPEDFTINDLVEWRFGAEYRLGDLFLEAEHQIHDSDISPFDATRLSARYSMGLGPSSTFRVQGDHDIFDFKDTGEEATFSNVTVKWIEDVSRTLRLEFTGQWLHREEREARTSDGLEGRAELTWRHRQTELFLRTRYSTLETSTSDTTSETIAIGYRRRF